MTTMESPARSCRWERNREMAPATEPSGSSKHVGMTLGVMLRFAVADLETTYERALTRGGQKVAAPDEGTAYVRADWTQFVRVGPATFVLGRE